MRWAAAASGAYTLLSTTTLSGSSTSITSISGAYTDLYILIKSAGLQTTNGAFRLGFNTSAAGNYTYAWNDGGGAAGSSSGLVPLSLSQNCDTGVAANTWAVYVSHYAEVLRSPLTWSGVYYSGGYKGMFGGGAFESAAAITSVQISCSAGTFNAGTVYIYGVK